MIKKYYTILILIICLEFLGFTQPAEAGVVWFSGKNISVAFDGLPFNLSNWAPGMSDIKSITIENNENFDVDIYFKAEKTSGDDILANALTITVGNESKHLSDLFDNNLSLASISAGKSQDYDIAISFDSDAGNEYQNKTIDFNFIIIVEQTGGNGGGGGQVVIPGGGGGGSALPAGLTLNSESVQVIGVGETSVTITWTTSYMSTSQVVYSLEGENHILDLTDSAVNYGYTHAAPEPEDSTKVTSHTVTISGLTPGNTYYFRCVSHASPPTISWEFSFTTLAMAEQPPISPTGPVEYLPAETPTGGAGTEVSTTEGETTQPGGESTEGGIIPEVSPGPSTLAPEPLTGEGLGMGNVSFGANMLAAIGNILDSKFLSAVCLFVLIVLIGLLIKEARYRYLERKRKKNQNKRF